MSLKFGIYLVEQRIISPEQFCGLVKIQQEASMSLATLALRKNILTIKQVAKVLDIAEANPEKSFVNIAMEQDLMDRADADQLLHYQQMTCPTMRKLVVECGLLTQRQSSVLYLHFERHGSTVPTAKPSQQTTPEPVAPATPQKAPEQSVQEKPGVRQPKFKQRPVVVRQFIHPS
ncbi:MAG: hypothetical protein AB8B55_07970 [Mariniblastus sp.]